MSKARLVGWSGFSAEWKGIAVGLTSGDGVVVDRAAAVPVRNAIQIHPVGFIASPVVGGFRGFVREECVVVVGISMRCVAVVETVNKLLQRER